MLHGELLQKQGPPLGDVCMVSACSCCLLSDLPLTAEYVEHQLY